MSQMLSLHPMVTVMNKTDLAPSPLNFMVSREVETNKIVPLENTKSPTVVSVP